MLNTNTERFIPNRGSILNYQIKKNNKRLNENSLQLMGALFVDSENYRRGDHALEMGGMLDNRDLKVLSFCGPYTMKDKKMIERCAKNETKKCKRERIDYEWEEMKIMDAPGVKDDWHYSLMNMNHVNDKVVMALGESIYIYDLPNDTANEVTIHRRHKRVNNTTTTATTGGGGTNQEQRNRSKALTAIKWVTNKENQMSYGDINGDLFVVDHVVGKIVRRLRCSDMICDISSPNAHVLTVGTKDGYVVHHDQRIKNSITSKQNMFSTVTSVDWNKDGSKFSCGLIDKLAYIFDANCSSDSYRLPLNIFKHKGPVGNVQFCPDNNNIFATSGGSFDNAVRFFEVDSGVCFNEVTIDKHINHITWRNDNKLMISAGNDILLASPNNSSTLFEKSIFDSSVRILSLALSSDDKFVFTLSSNETIGHFKFENKFERKNKKKRVERSVLWDLQLMR